MFTISNIILNGFETVILKDTVNDTSATIIPACGGILHSFEVQHNNKLLNVIDSYQSLDDFTQHVESKGFKSCKLSPFVCRIDNARYTFNHKPYTVEKFILNGSALHGLLYDKSFNIIHQHADEAGADITIEYHYHGIDQGYPFLYDCAVTYQLKKNNELIISTQITNKDVEPIPMQDGWHPYFNFGGKIDDLLLEFQSKEQLEFNGELIPTGKLIPYQEFGSLKKIEAAIFDNCFTLNFFECQPLCVLRDPTQKIQLEIRPEKSYPYLQIYTPPHRNSIAIENLSSPPNAFNNGIDLKILAPGEIAVFTTAYTLSAL